MAKNIGNLGKCDQRWLWKFTSIVNPFDILFKKKIIKNLTCEFKMGENVIMK